MPYESRFGCTSKRNDCRHDPGYAGIFIHGGACDAGPFYHGRTVNRFSLTLPTRNKRGEELPGQYGHPEFARFQQPQPTFQRAHAMACTLRREVPSLAGCSIYACTDLQMDTTYSGSYAVQRVG